MPIHRPSLSRWVTITTWLATAGLPSRASPARITSTASASREAVLAHRPRQYSTAASASSGSLESVTGPPTACSFAHPQFPSRGPRPQQPEKPAHHPSPRAVRRADVLVAQQVGAQVIGRDQRAIGSREQLRTTNGAPGAIGEKRGADARGGDVVVHPVDLIHLRTHSFPPDQTARTSQGAAGHGPGTKLSGASVIGSP